MDTFQLSCKTALTDGKLWRRFMTRVAMIAAVSCLSSATCFASDEAQSDKAQPDKAQPDKASPHDRPNLVFILVDDMGCFGNSFNESPRIDRLCREGMKFTYFYAATPVCSSTRSTIQSGQYSTRTGITNFVPGHFRPFERLIEPPIAHNLGANREVQTPGELFTAAGYATGHFGKWHIEYANDLVQRPGHPFPTTHQDKTQLPENRGYQITERTIPKSFFKQRGSKPIG